MFITDNVLQEIPQKCVRLNNDSIIFEEDMEDGLSSKDGNESVKG